MVLVWYRVHADFGVACGRRGKYTFRCVRADLGSRGFGSSFCRDGYGALLF